MNLSSSKKKDGTGYRYPVLQQFGLPDSSSIKNLESERKPKRIVQTYVDDLDIISIHREVLRQFTWEDRVKRPQLERMIKMEQENLDKPTTLVEYRGIERKIQEFQKELDLIISGQRQKIYFESTLEFLRVYQKMGPVNHQVTFGSPESIKSEDNKALLAEKSIDPERIRIIELYLSIARNYLDIDIIRQVDRVARCLSCNTPWEELEDDNIEMGYQKCSKCGYQRETMIRTPLYRDSNRINSSMGSSYENEVNFYKAFLRFQGKQPVKFPERIFEDLDDYFRRLDLPIGAKIRTMDLVDGHRGNTDKEMMYSALSDKGYANHYEDINLICHIYWGWDLPDLSYLENSLMDEYRFSQPIYESIPKQRESSLNTQYRLYRHLQRLGYKCSQTDFKMIKTTNIIDDYEEIWEEMCRLCGWTYTDPKDIK